MTDVLNICRARSAAGALLITSPSAAYITVSLSEENEQWEDNTRKHPRVDGDEQNGQPRLEAFDFVWVVRIVGADWAQVVQRRLALKAATRQPRWLFETETGGVVTVWRARNASSRTSSPPEDVANNQQIVTMTFRVQPTSTITFPEEP